MIRVKNPFLRELFEQLRFASAEQRQKHLAAAEKLLLTLNPDRQYPLDFIVFRLTGYRWRSDTCQQLIDGRAATDDIRVWAAQLSSRMEEPAKEQGEPVFTTEQLAQRFAVSTKTIRRWQRIGLTGRIYRFPDGKKRKGFTESAVSRFCADRPDLADSSTRTKRLTKQQRQQVIDTLCDIAAKTPSLTRRQLLVQAGRQLNRSSQTIGYILRRYERGRTAGILCAPRTAIKSGGRDAAAIYRLRRHGTGVQELSKTCGKSRSAVYRIIRQQWAKELLAKKIEYIYNPEFDDPDAEDFRFDEPEKTAATGSKLLNRRQEETLFRTYNYLKFQAAKLLEKLSGAAATIAILAETEKNLKQAEKLRQRIIEANLPLVVSIAGRHLQTGASLAELVSRGNLSLMRAVEKFDYNRGYRFSTYASLAIAKDFARFIPADANRPDRPKGTDLAGILSGDKQALAPDIAELEQAQRDLRKIIENDLDRRQRYIILNHFALDEGVIPQKPKTLKQIGEELGLSKERVRQLELQALQKLRHSLSPEQFDLLMG